MNLGGSPVGVLIRQPSNQAPDFIGYLGAAAPRPRPPAPVQTETSAVPADDSLGLHDDQDIGPTEPEAAERGPEEPVQRVQRWPRPFAFEYGELLPKGENLQGRIPSIAEENADHGEDGEDE